MDAKARAKTTAATQDHLEVKEIIDDLIMTSTGSVALVVQTTAVNFDLLSEFEQDNKIYAFGGLLNSLNFHIQILVRTNRIDISNYVDYLRAQSDKPMTEGLKHQLEIYTQFIQNLIVQNDVLDKKFYIIIPYNPVGTVSTPNPFKKKDPKEKQEMSARQKERTIEQAKIFLYPKRDHILKQLSRMGLMGHQLTTNELMEIMYSIYNPEE
ncbi:MAG: hypothetical protein UT34_C0002G0090 [candidate division WS6 bacterium GW2011_GWF2_39_15]|uniref:Uncharacterized protein n=1 Tax=candidate division WS6 bacterium GW2011_GWF2_39_15 TaxID=1619100 RepID=A0A0G0MR33_9BACT|nr:MAG: hypothetical protein UT34_C0002G0090 [candidate division WS6 bacterium GW2011_GWF2_39_15]